MTHEQIIAAFSKAAPWLALTCAMALPLWGWSKANPARTPWATLARRIWLPAAALILVLWPFRGVALGRWVVGCNANFSIPLTLWLGLTVLQLLTGRRFIGKPEGEACWKFGLVAGVVLYPMALGLTPFDPYAFGWRPTWLMTALLAVMVAWLAVGNRFGAWLLVASLAYNLRLLESPNLWDYLVDPFYCIGSLIAGIAAGVERLRDRRGNSSSTLESKSAS